MAIDKGLFTLIGDFASKLSELVAETNKSQEDKDNAEICTIVKKMMQNKNFDSNDFESIIKRLEAIYLEGHRHSYSNISSTIYTEKTQADAECKTSGKDNELLDILADNNNRLHEQAIRYFENKKISGDEEGLMPLVKFHKLYDHINLEVVRLKNYDDQISRAIKLIEESNAGTQHQIYEFQQQIDSKSKEIDESIQMKLKDAKDESNKMKSEYISILGIFASIVLAFTAGMAYSTSVLSNIHRASIYRTIIITALIGMILIGILWLLMDFIKSIHGNIKRNYWYIAVPELVLILIICVSFFAFKGQWFEGEEKLTQYIIEAEEDTENKSEEEENMELNQEVESKKEKVVK